MGTPLPAGAATTAVTGSGPGSTGSATVTTSKVYNIFLRVNGVNVCLDASYQFSLCQTSKNPDDPPSLQRWVLVPAADGTYQIWNRGGTSWCLDLADFDAPCSPGDGNQQWVRVRAGDGAYYIEHQSPAGENTCLDEFWTFKTCSRGDRNQLWKFRPG
jgi:hypothetical protein